MKYLTLFIVLLMIFPVFAQDDHQTSFSNYVSGLTISKPAGFLDALLKSDKFSMSQSYSLSYYSAGKYSGSMGLYLNTLKYQFSDPLMMQVSVGYLHQPFGGVNGLNKNPLQGEVFLESAMFQYKPTENMSITVDYRQIPRSAVSPYSYYYYNR